MRRSEVRCRCRGWSRRLLIVCSFLALTNPAFADGASGTYVGKGTNSAFFLQIVETSDGRLTGRYEQILLEPNGKLDDTNAAITGAVDGQTIVVTIKPPGLLADSLTASGTLEGRMLHLTGSNGLTLNLVKSDEADFRAQLAVLTEQARQMDAARAQQEAAQRRAKAEADYITHIHSLTEQMDAFTARADMHLKNFPPTEQRYRTITERMRAALARERTIYGDGQAAVARSQISISISQAEIAANQIHIEVGGAYQNFDFTSGPLLRDSIDTAQGCHRAHADTAADPVPPGMAASNSACLSLLYSAKKFWDRTKALREAFARIESVWQAEHLEQENILQASNETAR
jgi:hypothetical protein